MKKVVFLFLTTACLFQLSGLAQKAQVGITAGTSFANIYGNLNGQDNRGKPRAGFTTGLIVDAPIGKSNFSFQPGIHYVQKGKYTVKTDAVKEADALRYADLVLNFVHYTKGSKTRLFFGLGPQLGFNLPSKKVKIEDDKRSELRSISFGKTVANDYRGIDYGVNGLMGLRFSKGVYFSVNYTFGLRNIVPAPSGDDKLRNGYIGVRLGYLFPANQPEKAKKEKKKK